MVTGEVPELPITVRKLDLSFPSPEEFDPVWIRGNPTMSYFLLGLSLYLPYLEPYLIKGLRAAAPLVEDAAVGEALDKFCRQEAQHYQQHARFNALIHTRDYPELASIEARCQAEFDAWLANKPTKYNVGFAEGFESYTTQTATKALNSGALDSRGVEPKLANLFRWHLTEEIEHRTVAFDIWEHLYGDYGYRVKMCWTAQWHMLRFIMRCMDHMSRVDTARHGAKYKIPALGKGVAVATALYHFAVTYLPNYSPYKLTVSPKIRELADGYTQQAQSTSV